MAINFSKRDKRFSFLIVFLLFLFFASGILLPILTDREKNNWDKTLIDKIDLIENSISITLERKNDLLVSINSIIKNNLRAVLEKSVFDQKMLFDVFNDEKFQNYSLQLYNSNGELTAWNSEPVLHRILERNLNGFIGQTFFGGQKLITYLSLLDTLKTSKEKYFLVSSLPIEKHYSLSQKDEAFPNIVDSLSHALQTEIKIDYSSFAKPSKDGRKYSCTLLNNFKNKIGVATFDKPSLDSELDNIRKVVNILQNILLITMTVVGGFWLSRYIFNLEKKIFRFILFTFYLTLLRILFFLFGIPSSFVRNSLADPADFSSVFAFGMVRSPLEFFITVLFLLAIVLVGYRYVLKYFVQSVSTRGKEYLKLSTTLIICTALFLLSLRGFGASIRSVIFDSTIRYFKEFSLIPSPPVFLMSFNILALGFCLIVFSIILLLLIFIRTPFPDKKKNQIVFVSLFFLYQIFGWIFDAVQNEPQGTPIIRIIFITIIFAFVYFIIFTNKRGAVSLVYYAFCASIISVGLLTYYNSTLEKESLKTTAQELTRANEDVVEFMVFQTLSQLQENEEVINSFYEWKDLSADAFILWTNSLLYREGIRSAISFYDREKNFIGGFQTEDELHYDSFKNYIERSNDSLKLFHRVNIYDDEKTLIGVVPIKGGKKLIGYLTVSAVHDEDYFNYIGLPKFLISPRAGISSTVDFDKLMIFDFHDGELNRLYGMEAVSFEDEKKILSAKFSKDNEAWLLMSINEEKHLVYAQKIDLPGKKKILAVALEEKNFSWNLSDFFKIFFVHTIIIALLLLIFSLTQYRKIKAVYSSYRSRLIGAFLIISLIPLFIIALYFRNLTEEKNSELVERRLNEIAEQVESYLSFYLFDSSVNQEMIFEKAARDLNINFSVYKGAILVFSSKKIFNDVGLFPMSINSIAFSNCVLGNSQKIFLKERFENYPVNSVYAYAKIAGEDYVIQINDLFNKIAIPLSDIELDIFLFGIFSLTVILLIIFSTVLAGQISLPIRKITNAAKSVGSGDLNVEVTHQTKGEIKDLIDGFNMMVKKIKQSQSELALLERETAWKEMAKQVAHEIKNPLTPMKLSVQQLIAAHRDKSQKFDSIFEKVTSTIVSQIEILKNIASEFSNFGRMPLLNIEKLNVVTSIQEVLNLFTDEKREIKFEYQSKNIFVNADKDHLKRAIINLVRNSIQAYASTVTVEIKTENGFCAVRMIDDGKGIDKENIEKIFEENFTTKKSGTGLGLSMAKRFIESIGGKIFLEKTSGEGTTFLITLPLAE